MSPCSCGQPHSVADDPVIRIHDVDFAYQAGSPVLSKVSFTVNRHDAICVVGPNGGGKSTLLNLILGLLKPQNGTVEVLGHAPDQVRSRLGYMPQYSVFDYKFPVNVMDVVLMGRLHSNRWGRYAKEDRAKAEGALEELGMQDMRRRPFFALSGGQRQRVLIARALAGDPEIMLLDEPTSNVDPVAEQQFYTTLQRLAQRMTLLIVSHDLGFVSDWLTGVVCINRTAHVHPVSALTGDNIRELYGSDVKMIRHDHCCIHPEESRI